MFVSGQAIIQSLIFGLFLGSLYALIALGYTMVYGVLKFINFAHGDVFMWGAYFVYVFAVLLKMNFLVACFLGVMCCGLLGAIIEKIAYKPLRKAPRLAPLITAIGVSLFLESVAHICFTPAQRAYTDPANPQLTSQLQVLRTSYPIFGAYVTTLDIIILVTAFALMFLLHLFIKYTRMGKAMRATADDFDAASVVGINVDRVITVTFVIGSMLAAVGGILWGLQFLFEPYMGILPGIKAFTAAVVGGIGNIYGAMAGGLLMGLSEKMGGMLISTRYESAIVFIVLIIFLLFKPTGLFGKEERGGKKPFSVICDKVRGLLRHGARKRTVATLVAFPATGSKARAIFVSKKKGGTERGEKRVRNGV